MRCPNCAGEIEANHQDGSFVVCPFCRSASIMDTEAAKIAGTMAVLSRPSGKIRVGRSGSVQGRNFSVLGRVRYGYSSGFWDEWYLRFEDGDHGWLSEDEGRFALEELHPWQPSPELWNSLAPGDAVPFPDEAFSVREKGHAICEGGEGQLPFPVEAGESVPFIDCLASDRDAFLTLEFPTDEPARSFLGLPFGVELLHIDSEDQSEDSFSATAAAESRRRVHYDENRSRPIGCDACGANLGVPKAGATELECEFCGAEVDLGLKRIDCPECRHPITLHDAEGADSSVCPNCSTQLDLRQDEIAIIAKLADEKQRPPRFAIGSSFHHKGIDWRLAGALVWVEKDEDGRYRTREYLMHAPEAGYAWLSEYNGHFVWYEELMRVPNLGGRQQPQKKSEFKHLGLMWRTFESGVASIERVWGEMPWVAQVGDSVRYLDAIAPPFMLSAEWTSGEKEWFRGEYMPRAKVAAAFGLRLNQVPMPSGVGACQPYLESPFRRASGKLMLAAFGLVFFLMAFALIKSGRRVTTFDVRHAEFDKPWLSEPFEIKDAPTVCKAKFSANVSNSWVYLDLALINERDEAVLDFSSEISYYFGREGGESWSEGSKSDSVPFVVKEPGTYRLMMQGQAGKQSPILASTSPYKVNVQVREGIMLARWYLFAMLLILGWLCWVYVPKWIFHSQRWADT